MRARRRHRLITALAVGATAGALHVAMLWGIAQVRITVPFLDARWDGQFYRLLAAWIGLLAMVGVTDCLVVRRVGRTPWWALIAPLVFCAETVTALAIYVRVGLPMRSWLWLALIPVMAGLVASTGRVGRDL